MLFIHAIKQKRIDLKCPKAFKAVRNVAVSRSWSY